MGLLIDNVRFMLDARQKGCQFGRVATIGRQNLFVRPSEVSRLCQEFSDLGVSIEDTPTVFGDYCERFLKHCLGSDTVDSIDFSDYEQASVLHDMNYPIPTDMHGAYDVVIDAGSLEHIFNIPVAFANCMQMVRKGGYVFLFLPANNLCGHGFYQFSPEFFYRVFNKDNGFEVQSLVLKPHPYPGPELSGSTACYEVRDPDELRCRIGLVSSVPVQAMVAAKRIGGVQPFTKMPMQSDYTHQWALHQRKRIATAEPTTPAAPLSALVRLRRFLGNIIRVAANRLPTRCRQKLNGMSQNREYSFKNKRFLSPLAFPN